MALAVDTASGSVFAKPVLGVTLNFEAICWSVAKG